MTSTTATAIRANPAASTAMARRRIELLGAAQAEDAQQEGREEDLDADDDQRRRQHGQALLGQLAEAAVDPGDADDRRQHQPDGDDGPAEHEPVLEPEARPHAIEPG